MRWLPLVSSETVPIRLPLCDASSAEIETLLICSSEPSSPVSGKWRPLLSCDPALALWASLAHRDATGTAPASLSTLADWLASRSVTLLQGLSDEDTDPSPEAAAAFAELAVRSTAIGEIAARLAKEQGLDPDAARLTGLLHDADQWLNRDPVQAAEKSSGTAQAVRFSPANHALTGRLAPLRCKDPPFSIGFVESRSNEPVWIDSAASECAREAAAFVADELASEATETSEVGRLREAALVHWNAEDSATRRRLPALVARLTRLEQLETCFQETLEAEKLESVYALAYGAGHEINNPLANISVQAQTLLKDESEPERRRRLAAIHTQAMRAHEMIADLMLCSRPPTLATARVDLVALIDQTISELQGDSRSRRTKILRGETQPVHARADPVQLSIVLRAMCLNAMEALGMGGNIALSARPKRSGEQPWAELVVADDGPGIAPEVRRHLFDPFFSGREAGRGLGFGLAKCWRIVTDHGGHIEVESGLGQGAVFTIRLPTA